MIKRHIECHRTVIFIDCYIIDRDRWRCIIICDIRINITDMYCIGTVCKSIDIDILELSVVINTVDLRIEGLIIEVNILIGLYREGIA